MIRVALLDDHPVVLTGLQRLLASANDVDVVAAAGDPASLAQALDGRRADIVIADYDPTRNDTLAVCRRVKSRSEPPRVLLYTAYASPALAITGPSVSGSRAPYRSASPPDQRDSVAIRSVKGRNAAPASVAE